MHEAIQPRYSARNFSLQVQLYSSIGEIFVEVLCGDVWSLVEFELPTSATHGVQAITSALKNSTSLWSALLRDKVIKIELVPKFRARNRDRIERDAFHHGIGETCLLKLFLQAD